MSGKKIRVNLTGWGFALPAVAGFFIFNLLPMVLSAYYSMCDYNIIGKPAWTGFGNYTTLLFGENETFWISVTLIPQFLIWRNFHLVDTLWPLILPFFFGGGAFNIFLLRQFFLGIPRELDDAAKIDGASALQIFFRIMLPLSSSAIVVVALFTFLNCWNDFFGPIIYLNSKEHFTIAVGLLQFKGEYDTKWNLLMAASTMSVAPCMLVYLFGQKYLVEGIALTGMKA